MLLHHHTASLTNAVAMGNESQSINIHQHNPTTTVTSKSFDFDGPAFKNRHLSSGDNSIAASSSTSTLNSEEEEEEEISTNHHNNALELPDFELEDRLPGFSSTSTFCGLPTTLTNSSVFSAYKTSNTEMTPIEDEHMDSSEAGVSKEPPYPPQQTIFSTYYDYSSTLLESRWPTQPMILRPRVCNPYYCISASTCPQQQLGANCALNSHLQQIYRPSLLKQIHTQTQQQQQQQQLQQTFRENEIDEHQITNKPNYPSCVLDQNTRESREEQHFLKAYRNLETNKENSGAKFSLLVQKMMENYNNNQRLKEPLSVLIPSYEAFEGSSTVPLDENAKLVMETDENSSDDGTNLPLLTTPPPINNNNKNNNEIEDELLRPRNLYTVGDIIGYSKVVRALRNEALGQLNTAIDAFSDIWLLKRQEMERIRILNESNKST